MRDQSSKKFMITVMLSLLVGWEVTYNIMMFVVANKYDTWMETARSMVIANTWIIMALCYLLWLLHHERHEARYYLPMLGILLIIIKMIAFGMMMISLVTLPLPLNMKMSVGTFIVGEVVIVGGMSWLGQEQQHRYEMVA